MPGDPALVLLQRALEGVQVVERHDLRQLDEVGRQAQRLRHRDRMVVVADLVAGGRHRHHHGVVMAVVAALDLEQHVAAGVGAHQAHGVERLLGARVAEPPQRQAEALLQVLGRDDRLLRRLGEVRAPSDAVGHGRHDLGMRVADGHRPVAVVEVDVLVAVDVDHLRPVALGQVDRVRVGRLPARRDAAGQRLPRPLGHLARLVVAVVEDRLLGLDQLRKLGGIDGAGRGHQLTPPSTSP